MQKYWLPVAVLVFVSFAPHCVKRAKEVDADGNPQLRYFGPAAFALLSIPVFIFSIASHEERSVIDCFSDAAYLWIAFILMFLLGAYVFFRAHATLHKDELVHKLGPFKWTYRLDDLTEIEEKPQYRARFANGKTFVVLPACSGQKHFLNELSKRLRTNTQ